MRGLFYRLPTNIARCFWGYNLLWHLLAIFLTYSIVISGLDWSYYTASRIAILQPFIFPAIILGGLFPIIVPLTILIFGKMNKNFRIINTALALGQAAIMGLIVSDFYKAFTGRIPPPRMFSTGAIMDISQGFQFGFLRGGVFWGWPSSHTTIAFAMAVTLIFLYPKSKSIKILALLYAAYVGIGVSVSIHWFSEAVAGAIFGAIIGAVIGKSFYERYSFSRSR